MTAKGKRKVCVWPGYAFTLIGTDVCYILGFHKRRPAIAPIPTPLEDGTMLRPGEKLAKIGGKKTSAGYSVIWFDKGKELEYLGIHSSLDGDFVCFRQPGRRGKHPDFKCMVFAFAIERKLPGVWFFTNQVGAGRTTETSHVERKEENADNKRSRQDPGDLRIEGAAADPGKATAGETTRPGSLDPGRGPRPGPGPEARPAKEEVNIMDWHDILVEPGTWGLCAAGPDGRFMLMTAADGTGLDLEDRDGFQEVCVGQYIDEADFKVGGGSLGGEFFETIQEAIDFYNGGK